MFPMRHRAKASRIIPPSANRGARGESEEQTAQQSDSNVWVDGYGRSHYVAAASAAPVVSVPPDDRERRAPWRGYDEKCDDAK